MSYILGFLSRISSFFIPTHMYGPNIDKPFKPGTGAIIIVWVPVLGNKKKNILKFRFWLM